MYKAEEWRGKIVRAQFHKASVPLEEKEAGQTLTSLYPDGIEHCRVCGNTIWHYWTFYDAAGDAVIVGDECAKVVCGQSPRALLRDIRERESYDEYCRYEAAQAEQQARWWTHADQAELRRILVTGCRRERQLYSQSEFFRRAYQAVKAGHLSDKMRAWIEKQADTCAIVERTAEAMVMLFSLHWCKLGQFDAPIIADMYEKQYPRNPDFITGSPLSEKQYALIAKIHKKYRKQIANLAPWQRREYA